MKARIIGTVFILMILGALYVLTDSGPSSQSNDTMPTLEDANLRGLKIN